MKETFAFPEEVLFFIVVKIKLFFQKVAQARFSYLEKLDTIMMSPFFFIFHVKISLF